MDSILSGWLFAVVFWSMPLLAIGENISQSDFAMSQGDWANHNACWRLCGVTNYANSAYINHLEIHGCVPRGSQIELLLGSQSDVESIE